MSENIIHHATGTAIFHGGDPMGDCPTDWDYAKTWEKAANDPKDEFGEPLWSWDCGFKLNFDGPILSVYSRFYPPKTHYGSTWDGVVTVSLMGKEIESKQFDCQTLEELKAQVEDYIKSIAYRIKL